jgi:hypothetical protein
VIVGGSILKSRIRSQSAQIVEWLLLTGLQEIMLPATFLLSQDCGTATFFPSLQYLIVFAYGRVVVTEKPHGDGGKRPSETPFRFKCVSREVV